jgi:1-acyl-sn-glycerol-3-phosphate acyltransferase
MPHDAARRRARSLDVYHERTRRRGVHPLVYWLIRAVLPPAMHLYFRQRRLGRRHVPSGPVILAANHRSFLDPFVIATCLRRPIYFVAKRELFEKRLLAWLLNCLGAFPVRRGESDEETVKTALALLARGEAVLIFPEGTRVRTGSLGRPKRGVGRLALESGAPVVPVAVIGTERVRRGWRIRPVKVSVRCGRPVTFPRVGDPSPRLARAVTARIWPSVELQWEWLGGLPPLRTAAVVGAGAMGTALAVLLRREGLEVQLGCRTLAQADQLAAAGENERYLPGVALGGVDVTTIADIEFAGADLVAFAVPCAGLPAAVARVGAQIGGRSAVLVASKGLVPTRGVTPAAYVGERVRARAVASLGGPVHAREAVRQGASVVLATHDADLRGQLADVLRRGGLAVHPTDDVTGVELAACAKNAAALAAAAAGVRGDNLAGAAAGRVFSELHALGLASGARSESFVGLAGVGDLVATAVSEGSRNRRAGELVGRGVPGGRVAGIVDQTAESLTTVPLLERALGRAGIDAPVTTALRELLEGRITPDQWLERIRSPRASAARRAA